ncbi:MAG: GNAT family N-acetyltransferase [Telmatospirillum sp.]|nr:GNAT family N-acetyltransferase [Telmatospirillum sp.]
MICGALVSLGPILPADFPLLFRWSDDLDAAKLNEAYRPAVWKSQEELWFNRGNDPTRVFFAIRRIGATQIIGYVQILNIDPIHRSAMLGIRIGDACDRGRGFGTEAMLLAIDYCWKHLNLSRIGLTVFENNPRAVALYARLGFATEGVLRRAIFIDGRWLDVIVMGLLHPSRTNDTV